MRHCSFLFYFDARDRKITCTDRINATTAYAYDANNNLFTITDAEGSVTTYVYDVRNLLELEIFPTGDAGTTQKAYAYDAARRLVSRLVNTVEAPLVSETTNYVYDAANRLTTRAYPDETGADDVFTYDAASRLLTAVSNRYSNTVTRAYDAESKLTTETLNIDGTNYTITYAYDVADRQTVVTYPNGKQVVRSFTDRNQLQDIAYDGTVLSTSVYDNGMRETNRNFNNGVQTVKTYRSDNLISDIDVTKGGTNILDLHYTYDANKRKLSETDALRPDGSQTFNYDNEDRLTTWGTDSGVTNQTWSLSDVGDWNSTSRVGSNPISETRSHTDVHEVTAINGNALTYDIKGNLATNAQNSQDYIWDAENRMQSIGNSVDADYRYDALGRRVQKSVTDNGTIKVTTFVCGGAQVFTEYINGLPGRTYVYHQYVDEPIAIINILGGVSYYHQNHLFSVEVITDNAGALVETYDYDSHGKMTIKDGAGVVQSASSVGNAYGFTGRRLDAESGLYYFRARYFDVELGRFVSRDPLKQTSDGFLMYGNPMAGDGYQDGMSLYRGYYVPTAIDPYGMIIPGTPFEALAVELAIKGVKEYFREIRKCQVTIFVGHAGGDIHVPQEGYIPGKCSRYAIYSCGEFSGGAPWKIPADRQIPGAPEQTVGYGETIRPPKALGNAKVAYDKALYSSELKRDVCKCCEYYIIQVVCLKVPDVGLGICGQSTKIDCH